MATIQLKRSNTAGANPTTSNLALGELGINTKDGKFFLRKHVDGNTSGDTILTYAPQGINPFGTQTYVTKVVSKTAAHPYNGSGSSSGYTIDGLESPYLLLVPGNTYKFDQADSSNSGHPLRFYLEADKTTAYTTGVTTNGTPGASGAYTQIVVAATTPQILFYQCSAHGYMGSASYSVSDAIADGKVGTAQIATNAVTSTKIAQNSILTKHIDDNQVTADQIADATVTTTQIAANTIATGNIADNAVDGTKIAQNSILTRHIDDNQVTADQIADATITTTQIAANTIATANVADNAIDGTKIASNSILTRHIDDNQIGIDQLNVSDGSNGQVLKTDGSGTLSFGTVSSGSASDSFKTITISGQSDVVADSATDTLTLVGGTGITLTTNASSDTVTITGTTGISANAVNATHIATGAVGASELAATAVTAGSYTNTDITVDADGRITSASSGGAGTVADGSISTAKLADDAVTAAKLADTAVTAGTYGSTTVAPQITVDAQGRITGVSNQTISGGGGSGGIGLNQTVSVYEGSGDGSTTAFNTGTTILGESLTWVFIDGVYQEKGAYSTSGSTVTFSAAPPNGTSIEVNNLSNVTTGGAFNHNSYNGDGSTTAFTLSKAPGSDTDLIVFIDGVYQNADAFNVSGTTLTFDTAPANSTKVIAYTIGGVVMGKASTVDNFNGNGSTTAFTLSLDPVKEENTQVYVGGVYQPKGTYAVSGTTLTFSEAPPSGTANIEVVINQITTLTDVGANAVTSTSIAANAVGSAEIAANSVDSSEIATGSIDTIHIGDDQVTNAKLAVNSVSAVELAGNSVTSTQIAANQVTSSELDTNIAVAGTLTVSTVGAMGTHSQDGQNNFFIGFDQGSSDVGLGFGHSGGTGRAYFPCRVNGSGVSNAISLGTTTYKYKDLHLAGIASIGNLKIGTDQGTDGQLLTSTGSGVAWEDAPAGGPTFKTFGTSSIMIGDTTTGTIDAANNNVGLGVDVFAALTSGDDNVAVGKSTLDANTTGSYNTALGNFALSANTTADLNTALGRLSMLANTTGASNTAVGSGSLQNNTTAANNTAVGANALVTNTTGVENVAVGALALDANTTAHNNVAVGVEAMTSNTTGTQNAAVGKAALAANTTGNYNTAMGPYALNDNTTADSNTAVGHNALGANTTGTANIAVGRSALGVNLTGNSNVAVGTYALDANTTGAGNVAMGVGALGSNTTAAENTAVGDGSLTANTTGAINTCLGAQTLASCTTGTANTAAGGYALNKNTTGIQNNAFGSSSLVANTTGNHNCGFGQATLAANIDGHGNTALGDNAMQFGTSGDNNVAIGQDSGRACTGSENVTVGLLAGRYNTDNYCTYLGSRAGYQATGARNIAIGAYSAHNTTGGAYNNIIGYNAQPNSATGNRENIIGYNITGVGNGYNTFGSDANRSYNQAGSATWSGTSDQRLKTDVVNEPLGLSFINDLRPIKFKWKKKKDVDSSTFPTIYEEGSDERVQPSEHGVDKHGFLAQELESTIANYSDAGDAGHEIFKETSDGIYTAAPTALIPMLVKALQEADDKIDALTARIETLEG